MYSANHFFSSSLIVNKSSSRDYFIPDIMKGRTEVSQEVDGYDRPFEYFSIFVDFLASTQPLQKLYELWYIVLDLYKPNVPFVTGPWMKSQTTHIQMAHIVAICRKFTN